MSIASIKHHLVPGVIRNWYTAFRVSQMRKTFSKLSNQEIFEKIYTNGLWGQSAQGDETFYSGTGSHHSQVVEAYIKAVRGFLGGFAKKPNIVDLGCGDFAVGSQLRDQCNTYIAADIVPQLIERNKKVYGELNVDFRHVNLVQDELPEGDVAFVREVFQHLSNENIQSVLQKLGKYRFVVLTECVPKGDFVPNLNKPTGADTRLLSHSGVVVTEPPFEFKPISEKLLVSFDWGSCRVDTIIYEMRPAS